MFKRVTLSVVVLAVIASAFFVGNPSFVEAAGPDISPMTSAERQRVKQALDFFRRLKKTKTPSPAMLAEAKKHAAWLKGYAQKQPARFNAAFKKVLGQGLLNAAQKREVQKMAKAHGGYAGAVVHFADQVHKASTRSTSPSGGIRPQFNFGDFIHGVGEVVKIVVTVLGAIHNS